MVEVNWSRDTKHDLVLNVIKSLNVCLCLFVCPTSTYKISFLLTGSLAFLTLRLFQVACTPIISVLHIKCLL